MTPDELAALGRTLRTLDAITIDDESRADAATIRDIIDRYRSGGERAQIVAHIQGAIDADKYYACCGEAMSELVDEIASGAHLPGQGE